MWDIVDGAITFTISVPADSPLARLDQLPEENRNMTARKRLYGASYSLASLDTKLLRESVRMIADHIQAMDPKPQAIAFRGTSGAALAFPLALELQLGLIHVRKEGTSSHSAHVVEGECVERFVIVDDFVSTGATAELILDRVPGRCLGILTAWLDYGESMVVRGVSVVPMRDTRIEDQPYWYGGRMPGQPR